MAPATAKQSTDGKVSGPRKTSRTVVKRKKIAGAAPRKTSLGSKKSSARKKSSGRKTSSGTSRAARGNAVRKKTDSKAGFAKRSGARKKSSSKKYSRKASSQVGAELHDMKAGKLRSGGSGKKVTNRKQAIAIGLSEARRSGAKVPAKPGSRKKSK